MLSAVKIHLESAQQQQQKKSNNNNDNGTLQNVFLENRHVFVEGFGFVSLNAGNNVFIKTYCIYLFHNSILCHSGPHKFVLSICTACTH